MLFPVSDCLRIKDILAFSLGMTLNVLFEILKDVLSRPPLNFSLNFVDPIKKRENMFIIVAMGLWSVLVLGACFYMGACISCYMVRPYGPSIEKFITCTMGGSSTREDDREAVENYRAPIKSPDHGLLLDVLPKAVHDMGKTVVVNKNKMIIGCCAFTSIQMFMYLMGHYVGVKPHPNYGLFAIASSSTFWVSLVKLFAASHQYNLTMAKWVVAHTIVFEIVSLVHNVLEGYFYAAYFIADLCFGAIPILVAVYVKRNPVDKLYTIYYDRNQIDAIDLEA